VDCPDACGLSVIERYEEQSAVALLVMNSESITANRCQYHVSWKERN
jgi:hypothetical protein